MQRAGSAPTGQPTFYYDLGNPVCYLMAEQVMRALPSPPEWEPVLQSGLNGIPEPIDRHRVEAAANQLGIQPLRWPEPTAPESDQAMLAATYAKQIGRCVAFSLAAFRQAFAAGRDLGDLDTVLIAGAACEMHPAALLKSLGRRSVAEALRRATEQAGQAGVHSVPAIQVGERVFSGHGALRDAAEALDAPVGKR